MYKRQHQLHATYRQTSADASTDLTGYPRSELASRLFIVSDVSIVLNECSRCSGLCIAILKALETALSYKRMTINRLPTS